MAPSSPSTCFLHSALEAFFSGLIGNVFGRKSSTAFGWQGVRYRGEFCWWRYWKYHVTVM